MRRRRPKSAGFTIIETLISIAILAIALTGVMAALAYDAFASGQSGNYTFAVNYSRKLMDLFQSGQVDIVGPSGAGQFGATKLSSPTSEPVAVDSSPGNDNTNWHNLDGAGVGTPDDVLRTGLVGDNFWGEPGSAERRNFEVEKLKYGVNYSWRRRAASTADFRNQLVEIIVTTRWQMRRGFRSVQLRSYYVTTTGT